MNLRWQGFLLLIVLALLSASSGTCNAQSREKEQLARFEKQLEELRTLLKVPGLSAVIVRNHQVLWAKGFGFADVQKRVPATSQTPYRIASLTKTFAATLVLQLVEQGKLDLDEPMSKYSSDFKDTRVKIKHLLSHTSQGTPGERYQYSGDLYAYLTTVLEKSIGQSFRELIVKNFLEPLKMSDSVPGEDVLGAAEKQPGSLDKATLRRYAGVLKRLAQPYRLYGTNEIIHTFEPYKEMNAAAGLISTVLDLAKYDIAIDRHLLLKKEMQERAWTPFVSNSGRALPHGLGWFVQNYQAVKLIWHYGYEDSFSALLLKAPEKGLTFILLANSDALSAPFYKTGGVQTSAFACSFLRTFVLARPEDKCELDSRTAIEQWLTERQTQARAVINIDPKLLELYVGQYQSPSKRIFTVTKQENILLWQSPGRPSFELFPESANKFFLKARELRVTFIKNEQGQVARLEINTGGQPVIAEKIK